MSAVATRSSPLSPAELAVRRMQSSLRRNGLTLVVGAVVATLVVPPIFAVVHSGFVDGSTWTGSHTLAHYRTVLERSTSAHVIAQTLVFAAGSALLTVAVACVIAFLVERTNAPFRRLVYFTVILGLGLPVVVEVMGWILLIGPNGSVVNSALTWAFGHAAPQIDIYSMWWMIFVQSTIAFPALFLLLAPAFRMADPALEQAAQVSGAGRIRVLRTVTMPLVGPSVLAGLLLAFIIGIESFEVPALIGAPARVNTLATLIYLRVNDPIQPDFGAAAAFATILMLFTTIGLVAYQRATSRAHRYVTVTGKGYRPDRIDLLRWRLPSAVVTFSVPVVVLAPIAVLLWASFQRYYSAPSVDALHRLTLGNYHDVLHTSTFVNALQNTFLLGVLAAILVMLLGLVAAWTMIRRPSTLSRGIDLLGSLPLVVPGIVLSLAVLSIFVSLPLPIYNTVWIILLALVIHYLPWGLRYTHAGLISLHHELEEAADVGGATRFQTFARIVLPLMRPTLFAGGLFIFMATMRQLSLVLFLSGANLNVVSSWIWYIWNNAALTQAATAAMVVIVPVIVLAAIFYKLTGLGGDRAAASGIR